MVLSWGGSGGLEGRGGRALFPSSLGPARPTGLQDPSVPVSPSSLFLTSSWDPPLHGQALVNCRPKPETRDCDWAPLPSSPQTLLWGSRNSRSMQPPTPEERGRPQPLGFVRGSPESRRQATAACRRGVDAGSGVRGDEGLSSEAVALNPDPTRRGASGRPLSASAVLTGREEPAGRGSCPRGGAEESRSPCRPPPLPGRAGGG